MEPEEQAQLDELRQHLTEEAQDQSGYLTPSRASQLAALTDDELWRLYRKIAFANQHPHSVMIEHEMRARLIAALTGFRESSEKASKRLEFLTWVLVVLTVVIVVFTIALFYREAS